MDIENIVTARAKLQSIHVATDEDFSDQCYRLQQAKQNLFCVYEPVGLSAGWK